MKTILVKNGGVSIAGVGTEVNVSLDGNIFNVISEDYGAFIDSDGYRLGFSEFICVLIMISENRSKLYNMLMKDAEIKALYLLSKHDIDTKYFSSMDMAKAISEAKAIVRNSSNFYTIVCDNKILTYDFNKGFKLIDLTNYNISTMESNVSLT